LKLGQFIDFTVGIGSFYYAIRITFLLAALCEKAQKAPVLHSMISKPWGDTISDQQ